MGATQRSMPINPSSIYAQGIMQPRPGVGNTGEVTDSSIFVIGEHMKMHFIPAMLFILHERN